ncbi:hypothetical protein GS501_02600 [Saccharibacter sp. 17.LH.SD]|uniref:hypothetical protein n=1 Tax=Saccharibacter sp. 17.LH.SD TaxID=2689393 RepID=UPI0013702A82|nr:hypothetical protein [Saccharibacter sp. 17.LH.SD]MXV43943.1 hypothetical protein [Saccharibacter sp. 17.LH.SD]
MNRIAVFITAATLLVSGGAYAQPPASPTQATITPPSPDVLKSFSDAGIPPNDTKYWFSIGVKDGKTATALNEIFDQTVSDAHHPDTDNAEFFNNIHPIVTALNNQKFTLDDLHRLIAEHQKAENAGKAEELGPDLTNVIIDSAIKIHHGTPLQQVMNELNTQQHAIDTAEKQEQND